MESEVEEKDDYSAAFGEATSLAVEEEGEGEEVAVSTDGRGNQEATRGEVGEGEAAAQGTDADAGGAGQPDPELLRQAEEAGKLLLDTAGQTTGKTLPVEARPAEEPVRPAESTAPADTATQGELPQGVRSLFDDIPDLQQGIDLRIDLRIEQLAKEGKLGGDVGEVQALKAEVSTLAATLSNLQFRLDLTRAMPEAIEIAGTSEFHAWVAQQTPQVQALYRSPEAKNAVLVLQLYQSAQGKSQKAAKRLADVHGHGIAKAGRNGENGTSRAKSEDFSSAFAEATRGS